MDKFQGALRRSGSILKSMKNGHEDLHRIISDLDHMKYTSKSFARAQNDAWHSMSQWASKEANIAIEETFGNLAFLSNVWIQVQRDYTKSIDKLKLQFKRILDSELELDRSCHKLKQLQMKESECLKKTNSSHMTRGLPSLIEKVEIVKRKVESAQSEVNGKILENEQIKLLATKQGLDDIAQSSIQLSDKNGIVSNALYDVTRYLPDIESTQEIQNLQFSGSEEMTQIVRNAQHNVFFYSPTSIRESAPPPPYAVVISQNSQRNSAANPRTGYSMRFADESAPAYPRLAGD